MRFYNIILSIFGHVTLSPDSLAWLASRLNTTLDDITLSLDNCMRSGLVVRTECGYYFT